MSIRLLLIKSGSVTEIFASPNQRLAELIQNTKKVGPEFGQCGFNLECGTCAVKLTPLPEKADIEEEMVLRSTGKDLTFRCSCQIKVTEALNDTQVEIL